MSPDSVRELLPFVLDKDMYNRFQLYLLELKQAEMTHLMRATEAHDIYRAQGKVALIEQLQALREIVRGKKQDMDKSYV
jgi:uncharacterized protein YehS (DUF1456 family)